MGFAVSEDLAWDILINQDEWAQSTENRVRLILPAAEVSANEIILTSKCQKQVSFSTPQPWALSAGLHPLSWSLPATAVKLEARCCCQFAYAPAAGPLLSGRLHLEDGLETESGQRGNSKEAWLGLPAVSVFVNFPDFRSSESGTA